MDFEPQELLPAMPPMVQRACVEGSTGKKRPCGFSAALRWVRTSPGSTSAVPAAASIARMRRRCLLQSMTSARLTVWPHWLVPPPRASTGTPCAGAIARPEQHVPGDLAAEAGSESGIAQGRLLAGGGGASHRPSIEQPPAIG